MSDNKLQLLHIADLLSAVGGMEAAIGDQKPEMVAFWTGKVLAAFNKCKADGTVEEFQKLKQEILG